jgi:hypothetical protein
LWKLAEELKLNAPSRSTAMYAFVNEKAAVHLSLRLTKKAARSPPAAVMTVQTSCSPAVCVKLLPGTAGTLVQAQLLM